MNEFGLEVEDMDLSWDPSGTSFARASGASEAIYDVVAGEEEGLEKEGKENEQSECKVGKSEGEVETTV